MGRPHLHALFPHHPPFQFPSCGPYVCSSSRVLRTRLILLPPFYRAEALFNAVKKQYGLHSFLLPLHLPTDPLPAPVPVPALPPRLPTIIPLHSPPRTPQPSRPNSTAPTPPPPPASPMPQLPRPSPLTNKAPEKLSDNPPPSPTVYTGSTLRLTQDDIQQLGRFVREFVTMSLIPWMEKCVVEWNENVSSCVSMFTSSR